MKSFLITAALGAGLLLCAGAYADAPAGATAQCKDGTYFSGTTHKGACKGHKGVQEWLNAPAAGAAPAAAADNSAATTKKSRKSKKATEAEAAAPAAPAAASAAAAPAAAAAAPAAAAAAKAKSGKHTAPTPASQITQKPGGGPGLVWVNSSSKVYHCQGDEWYGKTKEGSYMSAAAAEAAGNHAAGGKACK